MLGWGWERNDDCKKPWSVPKCFAISKVVSYYIIKLGKEKIVQITFDRKKVTECLQQSFVLPTYQRDYKWEPKHLQDLLNDIQDSFLSARKATDGRRDVLSYSPYFLGTIITTQVAQGGKAIVDGQQRITTLALLLSYVHRLLRAKPASGISPVDQLIRRKVAGQNEFNLGMDGPRKALFEILVDGPLDEDELVARIDSIVDKDSGTTQLWTLYQHIESAIASDIVQQNLLPYFFDYLTECVYLFEIGVPGEQDGHKVFVTMNDRGLKLSPIDLLKGFFLSNITNNEENHDAHSSWTASINKIKNLGSDEDSNFFKTWFRAKYAQSIRGKKRGDAPQDFELIGDSYHRWVINHKDAIGLKTSDDFSSFLTDTLPFYAELYCKIKTAERTPSSNSPHVFYNGARDLTLQSMVIMSAVGKADSTIVVEKKIRAISYYLDYLSTVRFLNQKENTYDNIRDLMFEIAKQVRDLDLPSLKQTLLTLISNEKDTLDNVKNASYDNLKRQDLLHLLSRIALHLEEGVELSTKVGFADYVDRSRDSKTFDIEHLLPNDFAGVNADLQQGRRAIYPSPTEFNKKRDCIGALILLPRGRNRSMKDMPYTEKLSRYVGENILAQTLTKAFFLNQPNWAKYSTESGISCTPVDFADATAIDQRTTFYLSVAKKIWGQQPLERIFSSN
jgi:hypothetical protein